MRRTESARFCNGFPIVHSPRRNRSGSPNRRAPAFALGDGPAIASDWADLIVPQSECFARGEAAIQRIGLGEVERTKYSHFRTRPRLYRLGPASAFAADRRITLR
jgi:hypothetical protein